MEIESLGIRNEIAEIKNDITNMWKQIYPVGSIYLTISLASPQDWFGGTWERVGAGKYLLGADPSDETGKYDTSDMTGGSIEHTHKYRIAVRSFYGAATGADGQIVNIYDYSKGRYANASNIETSDNTVNGALTYEVKSYAQGRYASEADVSTEEVHPPFYTVYMWKRTG